VHHRAMQKITARRLRWLAPFVAGAAVAAAAILPGVAAGSDHPALPARSATQLLADLMTIHAPSLSGTVVETARLGLPDLPSTGRTAAELSWQNLVTGSHTARVWMDGPQRQRIALVGDLAESDVVHNGAELWVYSSTSNAATHMTLPAALKNSTDAAPSASSVLTPSQAAAQAVASVGPSTSVTVDSTARVAGRAVYQIVLSPRDSRSLITSVTVALDSQTKVPLRVQVYGRDRSTPAFETTFTDISFATPPASVFRFIPPTGAKVSQSTSPLAHAKARTSAVGGLAKTSVASGSRVIGSGWTAVLVTSDASLPGSSGGSRSSTSQMAGLLIRSATRVPGGLLLKTSLVSVLLTDDGHLYVGAVDAASLQQVAATGKAL
jgi:outer membrane lipoprotein-sorting protein